MDMNEFETNSLMMKLDKVNVNERKYKMENEWRNYKIEK